MSMAKRRTAAWQRDIAEAVKAGVRADRDATFLQN